MLEGGSGDSDQTGEQAPFSKEVGSKEIGAGSLAGSGGSSGQGGFSSTRDLAGGIVVARGTGDGLILRLDGRVERHILLNTLLDYVESRRSFFSGQEVTLEWIEARPEEGVVTELSDALIDRFQLLVKASRMFERGAKSTSSKRPEFREDPTAVDSSLLSTESSRQRLRPSPVAPKLGERMGTSLGNPMGTPQLGTQQPLPSSGFAPHTSMGHSSMASSSASNSMTSTSLFDGVAALSSSSNPVSFGSPGSAASTDRRSITSEALLWDEADTRIIRETLRGGQKIESEHSVLIVGDVNSGAEIVAGGDIYVLGRLRGVAHAGAYDESGGGRRIFALQMQPTQLRIGSIISQGSEEGGRMPEIAKIEGNMIVVEPYGAGTSVRKLGR